MDTHLHLVVGTPDANLGKGMQRLVGGHAFRFNRRHDREGHLFTSPYHATTIEGERHFIQACVYVATNPVAARLCAHPRMWRWSSFSETADHDDDARVADPQTLLALLADDPGDARIRYRALVDAAVVELRIRELQVPG